MEVGVKMANLTRMLNLGFLTISLLYAGSVFAHGKDIDINEYGIVDKHKHFIRACIEEAEKAKHEGNHPFAAILVSPKGKVLHVARNKVKTKNLTFCCNICMTEFYLASFI